MNLLKEDYFLIKIRLYHKQENNLGKVIPAIYPAGESLNSYIKSLMPELKDERLSFLTNRNNNAISCISDGNPVSVYYHIVCVIDENICEEKAVFLNTIPDDIKKKISSFLSPSLELLETFAGIYKVGKMTVTSDSLSSYAGIISLHVDEKNSMILKYYSDNEIKACKIDIEISDTFDIKKSNISVQPSDLKFLKDIASQNEDFTFHKIRSALEMNKYIFVDHINKGGERRLKTFLIEGSHGNVYRDTGNRRLFMELLSENNVHSLNKDFLMRNLYLVEEFGDFDKFLETINGEICDEVNPETGDYYFLTWHKNLKEGRIYYSNIEKRVAEEPLVRFITAHQPKSLAYLKVLNAFLISLAGINELYLIEPIEEKVQPRVVSPLFAENDETFGAYGEVENLISHRYTMNSDKKIDIVFVVQERKIGMYFIKDIPDD